MVEQMCIDNFAYIRRLNPPVPHSFRINNQDGAFVAKPHAAAGCELYVRAEAPFLHLPIQAFEHSQRPTGRAGRYTFGLLLRADEEMKAERFHCVLFFPDNVNAFYLAEGLEANNRIPLSFPGEFRFSMLPFAGQSTGIRLIDPFKA